MSESDYISYSDSDSNSDHGSDDEPDYPYISAGLNIIRSDQPPVLRKIIKKFYKLDNPNFISDAYEEYKKIYINIESPLSEFYNKNMLQILTVKPSVGELEKYNKDYFMDKKFLLIENLYNKALEEEMKCFRSIDGKLTFCIQAVFRLYSNKRAKNITLQYLHI